MTIDGLSFKVGNLEFFHLLSYRVARGGNSDSYEFSVPYTLDTLKALKVISDETKGLQAPGSVSAAPVAVTPVATPATSPAASVNSNTTATPTPSNTALASFTSGPVPVHEADRVRAIIAECRRQGVTMTEQIAYVLATAEWECSALGKVNGKNGYFIPITEFGGPFRYDPWRGRGLVQLTWKFNYTRYQQITGRPLLADPTLVIKDFGLSVFILVHGSANGIFTGKRLSDYIRPGRADFVGARRIINGTDKAAKIAGMAQRWVSRLGRGIMTVSGINTSPSNAVAAVGTSSVAATATQVSGGVAAPPPPPVVSLDISANIVVKLPGVEPYSGFYTGYDTDGQTITIKGAGFRRVKEMNASPLIFKPTEFEVLEDGASLLYIGDDNRNKYILEYPLSVSQNEPLATQLSVIKDKKVKGYPARVTMIADYEVRPGDIVVCPYLFPEGEYIIDTVSQNGTETELALYLPIEVKLPDPPPPPPIMESAGPPGSVPAPGNTSALGVAPSAGSAALLQGFLKAALANEGKPSGRGHSPPATNNGRLACAWAVNMFVLKPVLGYTIGDNILAVVSVQAGMVKRGWRTLPGPVPGCICTALRMPAGGGHIGMIIGPGDMSLSNSSSRAAFVSRYPWATMMQRVYSPAQIRYYAPP